MKKSSSNIVKIKMFWLMSHLIKLRNIKTVCIIVISRSKVENLIISAQIFDKESMLQMRFTQLTWNIYNMTDIDTVSVQLTSQSHRQPYEFCIVRTIWTFCLKIYPLFDCVRWFPRHNVQKYLHSFSNTHQ